MNDHQIIGQAIVFIENHLYEMITARDAAEAVSYSYYHFHRYFSAVMGETIGSYIRVSTDARPIHCHPCGITS